MNAEILELLICKWDQQQMRFYAVEGNNSSSPEGVLICQACTQAYLVTEGIVVALSEDLMSESDQNILKRRLVTVKSLQMQ